ncbi:hypothetical protein C2W62_11005 [Candidatus Entotheonella serta]|nr:hypothetical protein C2W62_11005 [Candidatus Entotheonella serta]
MGACRDWEHGIGNKDGKLRVVGWDNRSSSFWLRSSDHLDHFGKHQSGIYMPQGPEFIRCDYPNPLPNCAKVVLISSLRAWQFWLA